MSDQHVIAPTQAWVHARLLFIECLDSVVLYFFLLASAAIV